MSGVLRFLSHVELAEWEFERAMVDSNNLVAIHRDLNRGRGRRVREVSLNRAVVVLTVAAWQAYVQDLVNRILETVAIPHGQEGYERFRLLKADALNATHNFSTPNAENTQTLLMNLGFDPWPHWCWQEGPVYLDRADVRARMNEWLSVRHSIAHGDQELPDVSVLAEASSGRRTLTRANAEACMRFFERVVSTTTRAAVDEFGH